MSPSIFGRLTNSILLLLLLLTIAISCVSALRCNLYHDIYEGGKRMRILPDICISSKYCVAARYSDPSPRRKNGFSRGCDQVDCAEMEYGMNALWKKRANNWTCRPHRDFGRDGEICCCGSDFCNPAPAMSTSILMASILTVLVFFQLIV